MFTVHACVGLHTVCSWVYWCSFVITMLYIFKACTGTLEPVKI